MTTESGERWYVAQYDLRGEITAAEQHQIMKSAGDRLSVVGYRGGVLRLTAERCGIGFPEVTYSVVSYLTQMHMINELIACGRLVPEALVIAPHPTR